MAWSGTLFLGCILAMAAGAIGSTKAIENLPRRRVGAMQAEVRFALLFSLAAFLIYIAFLAPGIYSLDGNSMLAVAESVVAHHSLTVPFGLGVPGVGGRIYSWWYPLLSAIAVPFVYIAFAMSHATRLPFHYLAAVMVLPISAALTAATAGVVIVMAIRMKATRQGAWLAGLSFAFGGIALVYSRRFFADPLLAFLTATALCLVFGKSRKEIFIASCCATLAILAKPTGIIVGPVLAAYLLARRTPVRISVLPIAGSVLGFAMYAAYNVFRFGHPMSVGYTLHFRLANLPSGAAGLLISPAWGLVWYCPTVILAASGFRKAFRSSVGKEALAIAAVFFGFLMVHSLWKDWGGGWAWGPRYLLPVIPGLCALTGMLERHGRKALMVLTAVGFLINAPSMFSFYERYLAELTAQRIPTDERLAWSVSNSPLLHAWPAAFRETEDARKADVREIFSQRGVPSHEIESSRALRVVAVWWWVLPIAGIPRWIGALFAFLLTGAGVWLITRSRKLARLQPRTSLT